MTVVHTYFYIVVDTQRGCHTLKPTILFKYLSIFVLVSPINGVHSDDAVERVRLFLADVSSILVRTECVFKYVRYFIFSWIILLTMGSECPRIYSGVGPRNYISACLFKPHKLPDIGSVWLNADGWADIRGTKYGTRYWEHNSLKARECKSVARFLLQMILLRRGFYSSYIFRSVRKVAKSAHSLRRVRPVYPLVSVRLPLDRFPWNLLLGTSIQIWPETLWLLKVGQRYRALYKTTWIRFIVAGDINSAIKHFKMQDSTFVYCWQWV
jgi:hypothetical protein